MKGMKLFLNQITLRGDFIVNDIVFEIGGKNKNNKQISGADKSEFLVKDDILTGCSNTVFFYLFGV
jgi:hypothetical protein